MSGWSGVARPAWDRLVADVDAGRLDAVVVFAISRTSRRTLDLLAFVEALRERSETSLGVIREPCRRLAEPQSSAEAP